MSNTNTNLQTQTSIALHNSIMEAGGKDRPLMLALSNYIEKTVPVVEGSSETTIEGYMENNRNVSQHIRDQLNVEAKAVQIILIGIDNNIYSTIDACPNACKMWKEIERLKQGELINVQDLETNLYWEFGKFTSRDGESLESYYSRFYKMMNELVRNKCDVNNHQMNVQFLLQLQPEWQRSQQAATRNRGKAIVNSSLPTYDQEPTMVAEDDEMSMEKEIDKLMALISLSFNKSTNLPTTTSELHQTPVEQISTILQGLTEVLEEAGIHLSVEQVDRRDDTDDETDDQELEAHYLYMAQIQEVTPDTAEKFGPIFDVEPLQKVQNDNDNYNVFSNDKEHPEQPESVNDTYLEEQGDTIITIDSLDMSTSGETVDQDDNDLNRERELLASLIEKLKCEIDDSKNCNKFLETSNKALVDKLKGEIEDFKNKNKSLESYRDVNYASKVAIDCAKAKGDLMSYKIESEKSFNKYTRKINDLNQTILEMKKELVAHQETISMMSQEKEALKKFHKTREDKELEKVIALENKLKVLDNIVYKTSQSVQTMNMLNHNCKKSFVIPEFLKKPQRANHRLYDIGCYNDNISLMLAPESDETIRLAQESRSKLTLQQHDIDLELALQQCQEQIKKEKAFKENQSKILPQNVKSILKNTNVIAVTPRQGRNARRNENGYHHNTMVSP
ncbi:hypothetical protein Tco_0403965 [Tanacetum coccineum]